MVNIFVGVVAITVCVPLALGKIRPNRWYGVRFPESYASSDNWYRINRIGGWVLMIWGIAMIAFGIIAVLSGRPVLHVIGIPVLLVSIISVTIGLAIYANRKFAPPLSTHQHPEKPS